MKNILTLNQPVLDNIVEIIEYPEVIELGLLVDLKSDYYQKIISKKDKFFIVYNFYCKTDEKYIDYCTESLEQLKCCPQNYSHSIDEKLTKCKRLKIEFNRFAIKPESSIFS